MQVAQGSQTTGQGGLTGKLVGKLLLVGHGVSMSAGSENQVLIREQWGEAGLGPGVVREL